MENFTYCTPTKYVFGRGAELHAASELEAIGARRVMVVFGGGSVKRSGLLDRVLGQLDQAGIAHIELGGIQPNPTDPKVREGIELCRRQNIDTLLAVGGGSVIDTAKAIAAGVPYQGDFWDFWAGKATVQAALPVGVVLTIPAAGSEGSGNSVITLLNGMHKISLRTDFWLRPKFALLNPELTFTLPPEQTAAGIADMMAHILERYFSPTKNVEITDRVAEGVLMAIMEEAPKVMANPADYEARANIMWSGTLAHNGVCGTGRKEDWVSHFMEHEISAVYDVTHGAGLAVVFPAFITFMATHAPAKVAQLARRVLGVTSAGSDEETALEGVKRLKQFFKSLGLPVTFAELGIDNPDIELLVKKLHENKGETIGGYYPLTARETTEIYRLCV
ncbi:MAG: iron-containing alcohol dehydrogenase [Firmicutes bacterium]|nr:iron-containing alcohol dehydrogenase [Bacillota bacterium]MCM1401475.1 iron-containing alcohol dehydrogenase [Bacteroides sp.]MCM1477410.1 iron-containing alcohol dehydrogenase [Bacteroides sp.]